MSVNLLSNLVVRAIGQGRSVISFMLQLGVGLAPDSSNTYYTASQQIQTDALLGTAGAPHIKGMYLEANLLNNDLLTCIAVETGQKITLGAPGVVSGGYQRYFLDAAVPLHVPNPGT